MKEKFLNHLASLGVLPTDRILVAASGGLDSMAMLHLFRSAGFSIKVAHVNFQLRGAESDGDEAFVKAWCHQHNIPFISTRVETNNYAIAHKLSIQMAARELRYVWFDQVMKDGFTYLATGHHLNDSLETALLNMVKGYGIEGMAGIAAKNKYIIRPLLVATRQELENYVAENGIAWREDISNQTDAYKRNFIRHKVIPILKELNPVLEETFQRTSQLLQQEIGLIRNSYEAWKKEYISVSETSTKISKAGLQAESAGLMLWHLLRPLGFHYQQCESILKATQTGKHFVSSTHQVSIDREFLILTPLTSAGEVLIDSDKQDVSLGDESLHISTYVPLHFSTDTHKIVVDSNRLQYPLRWRTWQAGDWFCPLGMAGRKKISDFLIDSKIPVGLKDSVTVLESASDIVWVVGMRMDDRFKLTDSTTRAVAFTVTHKCE